MIPFPLMGGFSSAPPEPIPSGVELFNGAYYRDPDGNTWSWDRYTEKWNPNNNPVEEDGHPLYMRITNANVGTDGSFRYWKNSTKTWEDVPQTSNTSGPIPLTMTDGGVNIATSIIGYWQIQGSANGYNPGIEGGVLVGTPVIGRPDLMDMYVMGYRADFFSTSLPNPGFWNAALVMTNVKRGRVWNSGKNVVVENSAGEMWAWGMNFYNQYGPWRSGVTSSSQPSQKINYFTKIPDFPVTSDKVKDIFPGVSMAIVADTDGKFWSKGINIGQFNDTDSTIRTTWTEIPASRFPGFKKFYLSYNGGAGAANTLGLTNCVWYLTDTGFRHFGNNYGIMDGTPPVSVSGDLPETKIHTSPVGLPATDKEPILFNIVGSGSSSSYPPIAIWYEDPEEIYVAHPTGGLVFNMVENNIPLRAFSRSSAPVGKHRNPIMDFNKEVTLITGFDGKFYASGTSTVGNGMSSRTSPMTFTDQKMDGSLVTQIELSDSVGGKTQFLMNNNRTFMVADIAGGSNYFGNGTFWKQTVTVNWASYPNVYPVLFKNCGTILFGSAYTGNSRWGFQVPNYNTVGTSAQTGSYGVWAIRALGEGHVMIAKDQGTILVGGQNVNGMFGATTQWSQPSAASNPNTNPRDYFTGTTTVSCGTALAYTNGNHFIFGKNYWDTANGQPVIPFAINSTVRWSSKPGFPDLPNFMQWFPALMGYTDDEGTLQQPFFMYRGTDGLFYAAGSNTTGALGTGNFPASRTEERWTFEPIQGSEVFAGNKNVKVYYGHGNTSCLLFCCEGKVYGIGLPNSMKWNDTGTISDPFFPGFNKRLNKITYLMDLPDVIWTRPVVAS
nr:MAG TPA: hypothetical protein [Caudoviricetes sp.]